MLISKETSLSFLYHIEYISGSSYYLYVTNVDNYLFDTSTTVNELNGTVSGIHTYGTSRVSLDDRGILCGDFIIGEGEERGKLEKMINNLNCQNSIFLIGFKKNVYNFINKCEIYISTAEYEDPGFTLLEAAFLKKKIISSLVKNGPLEMKHNGNLCYFFKFNNEKSFLNAIKKSKYKNLNKINAAQNYSKQFSINSHCKKLKKILN